MKLLFFVMLISLGIANSLEAVEYDCTVAQKFNQERIYSADNIKKSKFSVRIYDTGPTSYVARCSFSGNAGKVTCDRYAVDKIILDKNVGIKKYYIFRSQFDVQIYSNLSFVENNGRGGIAFGNCAIVSP